MNVCITTQEWFLFAPGLRGTCGVVSLIGFASRADAELLLSDRKANGEAYRGEYVAQACIQVFPPSTGNAFTFYVFAPVNAGLTDPVQAVWMSNASGVLYGEFCQLASAIVDGYDPTVLSLSEQHDFLCHETGVCPDGCDAAPIPERLKVYEKRGCNTFGCACASEDGDEGYEEADEADTLNFWKAIGDTVAMARDR